MVCHIFRTAGTVPDMESLTLYIIASLALILTPGPDILYVLIRGIANGRLAGIMSAIGVAAGILVHTMAAAMGLAMLLKTSVYAFWALKLVGGIYLFVLGFQMLKNKEPFKMNGKQETLDLKRCLLQGFLTNVLNPKVALFFIAFLPQFANKNVESDGMYMMLLGMIYALMTLVFYLLLGAFAGSAGTWLNTQRTAGKIRVGSATVLMLLGLRLLVPMKS